MNPLLPHVFIKREKGEGEGKGKGNGREGKGKEREGKGKGRKTCRQGALPSRNPHAWSIFWAFPSPAAGFVTAWISLLHKNNVPVLWIHSTVTSLLLFLP